MSQASLDLLAERFIPMSVQDGNDADHHQQLDQGETGGGLALWRPG
ncbi:MAG: hypothetical protein ABSF95_07945 [Verrucomicrobiota bacterium]